MVYVKYYTLCICDHTDKYLRLCNKDHLVRYFEVPVLCLLSSFYWSQDQPTVANDQYCSEASVIKS